MTKDLPNHARVVIIGGGIIGCSVAYHLTKLGWKDVALLERHELTSGTTWHAAGLVSQLRSSRTLFEIAQYGVELYSKLEAETGSRRASGRPAALRWRARRAVWTSSGR